MNRSNQKQNLQLVRTRLDNDDDDMPLMPPTVIHRCLPYQKYESVRQQRITSFYLSQHIGDPSDYTDLLHDLRSAQPQDIIYLHLNTIGGRLDAGVQIINAMKDSEARIVAVLDSKAFSLGTMIFLAADEFQIHDNCQFMIHNYSGGITGKGNEQYDELQATISWFNKLAKKYYIPFLTAQELDRVLEGKDMWMDSDEVKSRLKAMVELQQAELTKSSEDQPNEESPELSGTESGELPALKLVEVTKSKVTKTRARVKKKTA